MYLKPKKNKKTYYTISLISIFNKLKEVSRSIIIVIILLLIGLLLYKNIISLDHSESLEDITYRWIFPLTLIFIFSISLFLSRDMKVFFLINILTALMTLFLIEYILIKRTYSDIHKDYAKSHGRTYDSRSFNEVKNDLNKQGIEAYPFSTGVLFQKGETDFFSLASHSDASIIHCNESGEWIIFQSDEYGFNNPMGSFDKSFYQIVGIGDSFTSGYCVPDSFSFMSLIKREYPLTLNLGVTATGPLHQLAILKEYLISIKPKIILWNFFEGNDLQELDRESKNTFLRNYLDNSHSQQLVQKQSQINKSIVKKTNKERKIKSKKPNKRSSIENFISLNTLRNHLGLYKQKIQPKKFNLDLLESILIMAKDFTESIGADMVFVYIPSIERANGFRSRYNLNPHKDDIIKLVRNLNISLIDINRSVETHNDPLSLYNSRIGYHFNRKGNKLLSEIILDSLRNIKSLHE